MPADDVILNLRQIAGYDQAINAVPSDLLLLQRNGLGGPYLGISPVALVATALAQGGDLAVAGAVSAQALNVGPIASSSLTTGEADMTSAFIGVMNAQIGTINGCPIATQEYVDTSILGVQSLFQSLYETQTVWSVNGRAGHVLICLDDILGAGGAPIFSPRFMGNARAETPPVNNNSSSLATTAFVWRNVSQAIQTLLQTQPFVFTFNGRSGDVVLTSEDVQGAEAALLNSPPLTGVPTAPTAPVGTNTDQLATTAFVDAALAAMFGDEPGALYAPLASPVFVGQPQGPTAATGTATGQLATTAFVMSAVADSVAGVVSFNTRSGTVELESGDITAAGGALLYSPAFTGVPTVPMAPQNDTSNQVASTGWVMQELGGANVGVMSFNGRSGAITLTTADITGAGGAPSASPNLTGVPLAPTATAGNSSTQIATTAFVANALTSFNVGVSSFNGRSGAITLNSADISAAGGAPSASPTLTGVPLAPTPAAGVNNTQIATTAYVTAAIAAVTRVSTFNGRSGAVTLSAADVTATGALAAYLPLAGGTMVGQLNGTTIGAGSLTANVGEGLQTTQYIGINMDVGNSQGLISGMFACLISASNNGLALASSQTPVTAGQTFTWAPNVYIGAQGNVQANFFNATDTGYSFASNPPLGMVADVGAGAISVYISGGLWAQIAVSPPSDARLKERIEASEVDALNAILTTPVRKFVWRGDQRAAVPIGLIAQELERTMPEMVGEANDIKMVNHALAVPYLIRAIQQLEARVCDLEEGVKP